MSGSIERADVLVLGLGPAGACAAAAAARAGARVIAVDRRTEPGLPVQCAEFVPTPLGSSVAALAASVRQRIVAMATYVGDDPPDVTAPFPGQMLDRAEFDAALVQSARAAGADCRFGVVARRLSKEPAAVHLAHGAAIAATVIVGADGPRSRAGHAIGCVNAALVETRQVTVPLRVPFEATDIFLAPDIRGGYGWLFPKGECANLGAGVDPSARSTLRTIVDRLHAMLAGQGRVGREVSALTGGAIPVGGMVGPLGAIGATPVLLAGDAAGLANPVTGAGIAAAVQSGTLAGEAAAAIAAGDAGAGVDYAEELAALFGPSLARALTRRRELARAAKGHVSNAALRRGWIAYPEYWAA
ncbi:MAG: NAD(P)/FAD-dependent oxidoreductase [Burkholderiales bacterium]|nr:NAD(P)/FAD-dependent oxidoreductase [Burkholderiales bacterium]